VNEGIRVSMLNVPADSSTKTFMLQIVGWVGKIVIPMSEALRAAGRRQQTIDNNHTNCQTYCTSFNTNNGDLVILIALFVFGVKRVNEKW
jgi:hypothetical protein